MRQKERKKINRKIHTVLGGIIFVALLIVSNLFFIQVQNGATFRAKADDQYVTGSQHLFERGNIYFETKDGDRITAAGQKKGYKISTNPSRLSENDIQKILKELEDFSWVRSGLRKDQLEQKKRTYFEIARRVPKEEAKKIKSELGSLVSLHSEKWRTYPLKNSAAHVIGFLGYNKNDELDGRYGLERFYNKTLVRENKDLYTNFFARVFHGVKKIVKGDFTMEGDLVSTIEPQAQLFLEKELVGLQKKWNSASSGGIIMDPKTGEIIAMVSVPNYDNNNFKKERLESFTNPLVSNVYEFGSIMKPLIVGMGIEEKVVTAKTKYYDKGSVVVGKHTLYNFDKRGRGWVTTQDILNQSLNTGMVNISKKIPKPSFRDYFKNLGFGLKSGIDLPNDSSGLSSNLKSNRDIEFANISFGQGIALSPISFIKGINVLANKGSVVTPHVVREIQYTNGVAKKTEGDTHQVLSPDSAEEVSRMLVNVFDRYRDGAVKFDHYSVAAKTGTAQISAPGGGYYKDRNLHSFFGYFPAYKPRFIVLLYTVHPKKVKYSSETLIDPFRNIAKYLINYYHVPPDR